MERAIDFIMMMVASALLFLSILLSAVFSFIQEIASLLAADGDGGLGAPIDQWLLVTAGYVVPSAITYIVFLVVYWWLPNTKVKFTDILGVAALTTLAFEIAKYVFIFFLRNSAGLLASIYGSISTIMMFFLFVYIESIILLGGAMLSAKWSNHLRVQEQRRQNSMLIANLQRINKTDQLVLKS